MKESQDFEKKKGSAALVAKESAAASQETVIIVLKEAREEGPEEAHVAVHKGSVVMEKGGCYDVNRDEASKSLVSLQRSSAWTSAEAGTWMAAAEAHGSNLEAIDLWSSLRRVEVVDYTCLRFLAGQMVAQKV